ncbi:frataxin, mitochondrial-like isoform X4 [Malus sylvestris]|uniref:frataxin, mitochondrial-like isoform X4 n=1 Tax=Malus sylvestris TaxID=3752 RepID=UPI0021AC1331|nr:frataxin, mitochondrial-like isoform X4 [Malus sylvestris]
MASKLLPPRRLSRRLLRLPSSPFSSFTASRSCFHILEAKKSPHLSSNSHDGPRRWIASRSFCSRPLNLDDDTNIPAAIDYHSVLQEDEFHRLADSTIQDLQEKFEEYGDSVQVDDFDIDYGNEVLTLKLGDCGTYVLNKQTPNRQIWLSSPVRFLAEARTGIKWRRLELNVSYKILERKLKN